MRGLRRVKIGFDTQRPLKANEAILHDKCQSTYLSGYCVSMAALTSLSPDCPLLFPVSRRLKCTSCNIVSTTLFQDGWWNVESSNFISGCMGWFPKLYLNNINQVQVVYEFLHLYQKFLEPVKIFNIFWTKSLQIEMNKVDILVIINRQNTNNSSDYLSSLLLVAAQTIGHETDLQML